MWKWLFAILVLGTIGWILIGDLMTEMQKNVPCKECSKSERWRPCE